MLMPLMLESRKLVFFKSFFNCSSIYYLLILNMRLISYLCYTFFQLYAIPWFLTMYTRKYSNFTVTLIMFILNISEFKPFFTGRGV